MEANEGRFKLRDLLSVPMQRVLKYHLFLKVCCHLGCSIVVISHIFVAFVSIQVKAVVLCTRHFNYRQGRLNLGANDTFCIIGNVGGN